MKHYAILIIIGLLLASLSFTATVSAVPGIDKRWAVILCGYDMCQPDCQYLYDRIRAEFDGVYFLTDNASDPRREWIFSWASKYTLHRAIREWVGNVSDSDDLVFIFIHSHGGGYNATTNTMVDVRWELGSDEGQEIRETDVGIDFNGNGVLEDNVWAGVDECVSFERDAEKYWDDDAKEDLDWLAENGKYGKLVFFSQFCYGGGFVRDLSAENRIIISASNETTPAYGYQISEQPFRVKGHFSRPLIDALNLDEDFEEADVDGNNLMSVWEAFQYAWEHDCARILGEETPQLDDNGDGVSNSQDGLLSSNVYLCQVFTLNVSHNSGGITSPETGTYEFHYGTIVILYAFEDDGYVFAWWLLDGEIKYADPAKFYRITVTMDSDHTIYACFSIAGGGGGWPCPTLLVWNGSGYVDYGVIDIHNSTGEDVVRGVLIQAEDVGITKNKAGFRLREGWEGLNFSESVIDNVKLYALDKYGSRYLCPLIKAEHSNLGKVLSQLLKSDDVRVQIFLLETIDLTFTVPYPTSQIQGYIFAIEGCNKFKM